MTTNFFHPSLLLLFLDPESGIQDPGSGIQDPGSKIRDPRSGIRDPRSGIREKLILYPWSGSMGKKAPDPVSRILIRKNWNQVSYFLMFKNLKESFLLIFNDNSFLVEKRDVVEAKLTPSTHIPVLLMFSLLFIYSQHTYPSPVNVFLYCLFTPSAHIPVLLLFFFTVYLLPAHIS